MEDQIPELAQIALLRRDLGDPVLLSGASAPAAKPTGDGLGQLPLVGDHGSFGVFGQPPQVARHRDRLGTKSLGMLDGPGNDAAHQRDEQQHIDRGEPEAGEHVEGLHPIQPGADGRVFGQVLVDLGLVECALRQHRAGYRTERE
ncbi:Uncharacterised protein [Mycobacteroides abscessus subsp. abscessus]|nr:Uncharacterised protein [Mycobacteroides abscessus subsp. abscessus]